MAPMRRKSVVEYLRAVRLAAVLVLLAAGTADTQVIFLDFDTKTDAGAFVYDPLVRDTIEFMIEEGFKFWDFDIM